MSGGEDKWTNHAFDIYKKEMGLERVSGKKPVSDNQFFTS